jgi:hypothetical protein
MDGAICGDAPVQAEDEATAFAAVTRHPQQRFPGLAEVRISAVVDAEKQRLGDARIRGFLPLLAERAAASRLRNEESHRALAH